MEAQEVLVVPSRITSIAGLPPLANMQQEIQAITSNHVSDVMNEPVRWIDLLRRATGAKVYDILHFAGHLTDEGLVLGDEIITVNQLIMVIQTLTPKLVFISTCSGELAAERITSYCPCDVICSIAELDNNDAIAFSMLFYAKLLTVDDYRQAFDISSTGESIFRYFDKRKEKVSVLRGGDATDIAEIKRVLLDPYGGNGLVQRVARLEQYLPVLQEISMRMIGTRSISTQTLNLISIVVIVTIVVLAILAFQSGGGQ